MSFDAILATIVEGCSGCAGAVLMGTDGIPIAEVVTDEVPEGPLAEEIGTAGVEFTHILDEIRKASDALSGGAVAETVVVLAHFSVAFRAVDDETFLAVVVTPDGVTVVSDVTWGDEPSDSLSGTMTQIVKTNGPDAITLVQSLVMDGRSGSEFLFLAEECTGVLSR